jgi:RND family efflux transporter MFP subunit
MTQQTDVARDEAARSDDAPTAPTQAGAGWLWAMLAVALLAAGGGGYWWMTRSAGDEAATQSPPPPLVETVALAQADTITLRQTGFVRASGAVVVTPQLTERIVRVADGFSAGARVAEGAVLVELDATSAQADLDAARARIAQAEAARNEAALTRDRQAALQREDVASEAAFEDAQVALARAEADLAVARAESARAALALDDTVLRAPFDAIVAEERASVGQLVQAGAQLGRLVATEAVEIEMGLSQAELAPALGDEFRADRLAGRDVTLHDPASGRSLGQGRVEALLPEIAAGTRTLRLRIRVPAPFDQEGAALRLGELVAMRLDLPLADGPALRVRAEAVKGGDTLWQVADGALARHPVQVLSRSGDHVTLRADSLDPAARVMLSDLSAPMDGLAVRTPRDTGDGAQETARAAPAGAGGTP